MTSPSETYRHSHTPYLIGLGGKARSGKDTAAQALVDKSQFIRLSFADALKEEVLAKFPRTLRAIAYLHGHTEIDRELLWLMVYGSKPPGVRELLQEFGAEVRRADDADYWIKAWKFGYDYLRGNGFRVVCADVRFPNEMQIIRDLGGRLIYIDRPDHDDTGSHTSEISLDKNSGWDLVLTNGGSVEDLRRAILFEVSYGENPTGYPHSRLQDSR